MLRIGWFSTARGPSSRALLSAVHHAIQGGAIDAEIAYVFCSRVDGESNETDQFLVQVRGYGTPLITESFEQHRRVAGAKGLGFAGGKFAAWREAYDAAVLRLVQDRHVDVVLQAGYMLVWTPLLCERLRGLNLHPAEPGGPVGTWQQVIWQLIDQHSTRSGIYMHLVTPHLDQGPVVAFCRYPIDTPDLAEAWQEVGDTPVSELRAQLGEDLPLFQCIRTAGVRREVPLILNTLQTLAQGRLSWGVTDPPPAPLDLTGVVELQLAAVPKASGA
ncbi:MAG: hypothetical protein EXR52_08685 [Dehalococcoidia bacterium]|nr:hypothetical protein [Dehalococcoidia bacterium]